MQRVVGFMHGSGVVVQALVFDLDATLYDDPRLGEAVHAEAHTFVATCRNLSPRAAQELLAETKKRLIAEGKAGTLSLAVGELGVDLNALHQRFAQRIEPADYLPRDERVVAMLRAFAAQVPLVLYTNNNRALTTKIMDVLGIAGLFSRVFTIEDSWRPKPDLATLEQLFAAIGRQPAECLFVGDRFDVDLQLPQAMGAQVYQVTGLADLLRLPTVLQEIRP
jgi:putative hydrolase of the HAD superfamily